MDLDGKKYFEKNEKGEIMLEGMIVYNYNIIHSYLDTCSGLYLLSKEN